MEVVLLTLVLIGLVGGVITGVSPCVLPVLPIVFLSGGVTTGVGAPTGADGRKSGPTPKRDAPARRERSSRPYLIVAGLTISFSVFTLLGTLIISALPLPDDFIRWAGLVALVLLGIAMVFPKVQALLERPFSRIGQRQVNGQRGGFGLGLALGAVYVPCAGPVLAAITVAGATHHIGLRTVALTVAFAVGTAVPLLGFALAGRAIADRVRAFRERQRAFNVVAGLVVIGLAVALTFNVTDALQRDVPDYTQSLNKTLASSAEKYLRLGSAEPIEACAQEPADSLQNCGVAPKITGISSWFNTPGNKAVPESAFKGKVVLIDFWAYSCINCQRAIPHVEAWYKRYAADGLVVIGVHTPEYAFEHVRSNVEAGAQRLHITYPVALDNNYSTWNNFDNDSWPADYLIDSNGHVRHAAIGEGDYSGLETLIRQLLSAANPTKTLPPATDVPDQTPQNPDQTPETYLDSARSDSNANNPSDGTLKKGTHTYTYPASIPQNTYGLTGTWTVGTQTLTPDGAGDAIKLKYDAQYVYLDVGGTGTVTSTVNGTTTTFKIGGAPNIYPVVSLKQDASGTVTITLTPGLQAYSFTFG
jgi:cytochrome c biogenesis protein CcdA/thiol-disulfide isomerase/thioredoxin